MRSTSVRRAASSTFSVPTTFVSTNSRGCWYEYGNRDERAEVQDDLAAGERVRDRLGIHEVAGEDVDLVGDGPVELVEPAAVAARVVANEPAHPGAARHEIARPGGCR